MKEKRKMNRITGKKNEVKQCRDTAMGGRPKKREETVTKRTVKEGVEERVRLR